MVVISKGYPFGADKAIHISKLYLMIKGHNPNFDTKKHIRLINHNIRFSLCLGLSLFKLSENVNNALRSVS